MKELTTEEKAKRYDEALERARAINNGESVDIEAGTTTCEYIFSELRDFKDERIRKEIIAFIKENYSSAKPWIAWLEKQGEQNPTDKVEPKFHKGEWIIHQGTENIYQVVAVIDNQYQLKYGDNYTIQYCEDVDRCARLWTIQDAKDGDVLVACDESVFIYSGSTDSYAQSYIALSKYGDLDTKGGNWGDKNWVYPATKEQRDLLFTKMREAGYEWDFDEKELKKIDTYCQDNCKGFQETGKCFADGDCKAKREAKQKPAEWSEEDERTYRGLHNLIYSTPYCNSRKKLSDFLKSLKDRVQPKQEWSEEDEKEVAVLEAYIRSNDWSDRHIDRALGIVDELVNKVKSIKPQNRWKPTENSDKTTKGCL